MKSALIGAALGAAVLLAVPANAAVLVDGASGVAPTPGVPAGQGTLLGSQSTSGTAFTFAATFNQAVYRNAAGTLDFYFQVIRTGSGILGNDEIDSFTVSNYAGYLVDGFEAAIDPDGAGLFVTVDNPTLSNGTPSGSTTTFARALAGNVLTVDLGLNGLTGTQNSATYIFRTNATQFDTLGTFGIIDGSTLQGLTFRPIGAPVPEPATWAMMLLGFGAIGFSIRRTKAVRSSCAC